MLHECKFHSMDYVVVFSLKYTAAIVGCFFLYANMKRNFCVVSSDKGLQLLFQWWTVKQEKYTCWHINTVVFTQAATKN